MDLFEVSAREKRSTFVKVVVGCLIAFIIAPPLAQAATQAVRVTNAVKVKDSTGDNVESEAVADMGLFGAEGSTGAVAVRNFAGGGGFLGAADCSDATPLTNQVSITNAIVTAIIITGTGSTWTSTSDAVGGGQLPLLNFTMTPDHSSEFVGLGNGLTLTDALKFTCTAGTNGNLVVLGQ
ncbi:MAG: hypothetical protein QOG16_1750 [Actinomycetota bacterium]|nr:hypothetical protein [Actinomycetota bacterium]